MAKRKMSKKDQMAKAQKAAQSPAAKAKRIATFAAKRAARQAAAQQEFTDIPLANIPERPAPAAKPQGRPAKSVVIDAPGGIRITIKYQE